MLVDQIVESQAQTHEAYNEAKEAHAKLQQVANATIQALQESIEKRQESVIRAKGEQASHLATHEASVKALNERIAQITQSKLLAEAKAKALETEVAALRATSEPIRARIDYLLNDHAAQEAAWREIPRLFHY